MTSRTNEGAGHDARLNTGPRSVGGHLTTLISVAVTAVTLLGATPALAQPGPTVKIGVAPLVDPAAALTQYGATVDNSASLAAPTTRDPLVQERAMALDYDIDKIFLSVRDGVDFTPMFGLKKGARGVILDNNGTAFDQAQYLVEMLREADAVAAKGYSPKYQYGQITLTSAQFAAWFGVTDADAARRVLADGGIPATVTGSGTSFTVVMSHVWVTATIGGTVYAFDPSFKDHVFQAGVDVKAAMAYDGAQLLAAGATGATVNTADTVQNYNATALTAKLTTFRQNLETYIATPANGLVGTKVEALVGGKAIVEHPTTENRRTSLPYAATPDRQWDGQVPNALRTTLAVQVTGWASPSLFYADEIYGKPLLFNSPGVDPYAGQAANNIKPTIELATGGSIGTCDWYASSGTTNPKTVTLTINHPYAANAGQYMDRLIIKKLSWQTCAGGRFMLTNNWGEVTPKAAEMMRRDLATLEATNALARTPNFPVGPELAAVPAQFSSYLGLAGQTLGGVYQVHDLIGIAQLDVVFNEITSTNGNKTLTSSAMGLMLTMDMEAAVSVNPKDAVDAKRRSGMIKVGQSGLAAVESGVVRQEADGVRDVTSLTLLTQQNTLAQTPGNYPHYVATPATWTTIKPLLNDYPTEALTILDGYIAEGYSLFLPKQGRLGQKKFTQTYPGGSVRNTVLLDTAELVNGPPRTVLYRPSFYAFKPDSDGAYLIYDPRRKRVVKGGADVTITDPSQQLLIKPESPKPADKDNLFGGITVDGQTGDLSYAPAADLVDGGGDLPRALSLQRAYDATDAVDYGLGLGWKHNWLQTVSLSNSSDAALGERGGFGAASAIVGIVAISDLAGVDLPATADTPERLLAQALTQQWFVDQTINNVAIVSNGIAGSEVFFRRSNGTFLKATPDGATLVQTGAPADTLLNRRVYHTIGFTYTGAYGDQKTYSYVTDPGALDPAETYNIPKLSQKTFYLSGWTFADGFKITPVYQWLNDGKNSVHFISATNNLGRKIERIDYTPGNGNPGSCVNGMWTPSGTPQPGLARFRSSDGREVLYRKQAATGIVSTCSDDPNDPIHYIEFSYRPVLNSVVMPASDVWSYGYADLVSSYADTSKRKPITSLSALYKPSSATPAVALTLGLNGRVRTATDAAGYTHSYFSSPIYSETLDPLGGRTRQTYDRDGRLIRQVDPLGRTVSLTYDNVGRQIRAVFPEGNAEDRTYDNRSNLLSVTRRPKSTPTSGGFARSWTYVGGSTAITCANLKTCNRPATAKDARNFITNYAWDATYGDLLEIKLPADPANLRPETDFAYSLMGPTGSQFRMLTSKTELISATDSVTTNYAYNAADKYSLLSVTVDPAGLSNPAGLDLSTVLDYNDAGDLISIDGPRTDVADVVTYDWDANRRLRFEAGADPDGTGPKAPTAKQYIYDADGRLQTVEQGTGASVAGFTPLQRTTYAYDAVNNRIRETVFDGVSPLPLLITQQSYDALHRPVCSAVRMNMAVHASLPADACAQSTLGSAGYDQISKSEYDAAGQLLKTVRGIGTSVLQDYETKTYTANGKISTIKDSRNNLSTLLYDDYDRLEEMRYPVTSVGGGASSTTDYERYTYDANDNRLSVRTRGNVLISYTYDRLNRQTLKNLPQTADDVYSGYDLRGLPLYRRFVSATGQGLDYVYDRAGRLTSETAYTHTLGYEYDRAGNRSKLIWPDNGVADIIYSYDAAGRLTDIREEGATAGPGLLQTFSYDDLGRRIGLGRGNTAASVYGYDGAGRLTTISHDLAGAGSDVQFALAYSPANQILSRALSNSTYEWSPTALYVSKAYDGLNRDAAIAALPNGYDAKGNVRTDGVRTFTYDNENRLLTAVGPSNLTLSYDPIGRLKQTVGSATTEFVYDGVDLTLEYDGAGNIVRRYVHGPREDEPLVWYEGPTADSRRWLHHDRQGSVIGWSDSTGTMTANQVYSYGPWGEPSGWTGSRFRYTGQIMLPEAQLYHYKARVYDPAFGRFLQTDPIGHKDDLNLYAYVGGDPANKSDPTGLQTRVQMIGERLEQAPIDAGHVSNVYTDLKTGRQFTVNAGPVDGGTDRGVLEPPQNRLIPGIADKLIGIQLYNGDKTVGKPGREVIDSAIIDKPFEQVMAERQEYANEFNETRTDYNLFDPNSGTAGSGDFYDSSGRIPDMSGTSRWYPGVNSPNNPVNPPPGRPVDVCSNTLTGRC